MSQTVRQSPRPRGAAARRQEQQRRADRRLRLVVLGVAVAVLVVLGAVGLLAGGDSGTTRTSTGARSGGGAVPAGVDPTTLAVPVAPDVTPAAGTPQLYVWEDFQCPACGEVEKRTGDQVVALARAGEAEVFWRVTTFLDDRFPGENSLRAAAAWGCAIDAGRAVEFHDAVFADQPAVEGDGWTQDQLLRLGTASGIADADYPAYRACVEDGDYRSWALRSTEMFRREGVPGTPTGYLDGHPLDAATLADPQALAAAVRAARQERTGS